MRRWVRFGETLRSGFAVVVVFLAACTQSNPQTEAVPIDPARIASLWTRQLGSTGHEIAEAVATDVAGNAFAVGTTDGGLDGNINAGSRDPSWQPMDVFVVKYDPQGTKLWTRQLGTMEPDVGYAVATDATGNAFVVGATGGGLDGNTPSSSSDLFVAKYDPEGTKLWTRQRGWFIGGFSRAVVNAHVATDTSGNVFAAAETGSRLFTMVVKYDVDGTELWNLVLGSLDYAYGYAVATDAAGNFFLCGVTRGDLASRSSTGSDLFVVKYDPDGNELWMRQFRQPGRSMDCKLVATDAAGVLAGGFTDGGWGLFAVVTYDSAGNELRSRQFDIADDAAGEGPRAVAIDAAGDLVVAGSVWESAISPISAVPDIFVAKYDTAGMKLWTRRVASTPAFGLTADEALAVTTDAARNVLVAGFTQGNLDGNVWAGNGGTQLSTADIYVLKYGPNGQGR